VKAAMAGGVNTADGCGWWLAAGRSQLVAGWPVVAFLDLLEIEFTSTNSPLKLNRGISCQA